VLPTDLVEVSKEAESLVVCTRKRFFGGGCGFFASDADSGGLFGHLGQLHLAWKLGYNLSESFNTLVDLLGFRVQSYDLS